MHETSSRQQPWLNEAVWHDAVFTGRWERLGQPTDILEPATGQVISRIGLVGAEEVSRSAAKAREAQRDWAELISRSVLGFFAGQPNWQKLIRPTSPAGSCGKAAPCAPRLSLSWASPSAACAKLRPCPLKHKDWCCPAAAIGSASITPSTAASRFTQ